ncbi:MAG: polyprenyl synthetase family protein [Granulosicoccus sp.]|nr:polyprenyl synthetase family protein [Granulosicoccus sp.]
MQVQELIDRNLREASNQLTRAPCPQRLRQAIDYALFPGGARVRPKLVMAVAQACADASAPLACAAASAIECLHCASLVQDDLSCFDNAAIRRGKPTVHHAFDERLAILASDALIVGAFEIVSSCQCDDQLAQLALMRLLSERVGAVNGITAGQAWECEEQINTDAYHQAKTGSLFAAATQAGAVSVSADGKQWARTGACIGTAYQIADDINDVVGCQNQLGKPVHVDAANGRPNAVLELGVERAVAKLKAVIEQIIDTVPDCRNADFFIETVRYEAKRFLPKEIALSAA